MRPDVKVRLAQDDEAAIVKGLVFDALPKENWEPEFKTVFPHWLVAEIAGEIVGSINFRISLPIAGMEMLSMDPKLSKRERGVVASMLTDSAMVLCAAAGAEAISSMVPDQLESYLKVAQHRGYTVGDHGSIVFRRIP